jgi:hypothetical protein
MRTQWLSLSCHPFSSLIGLYFLCCKGDSPLRIVDAISNLRDVRAMLHRSTIVMGYDSNGSGRHIGFGTIPPALECKKSGRTEVTI